MASKCRTSAVQAFTLDRVDTAGMFLIAKLMMSRVSRVSTPKRERLFGAAGVCGSGHKAGAVETSYYTLDTLDRRKKTRG